jgi:hypothetical protein
MSTNHQIELTWIPAEGQLFGSGFADTMFDKKGPHFQIRDEYGNRVKLSPKVMYAMFLALAKSYDVGVLPTYDFSGVNIPVTAHDAPETKPV